VWAWDNASRPRYTRRVTFFCPPCAATLPSSFEVRLRQIHVCAWLFIMSSLAAACGGEQFTGADPENEARGNSSAGKSVVPPTGTAAGDANDVSGASGTSHGGSTSGRGGMSNAGTGTNLGGDDTDASGGSADTPSEECAMGAVKLRMLPSSDLPVDYLCDAGCGTGWLTITDANGSAAFSLFPACGSTSCESCSATPCAAAACVPTPLTAEGSALVWNGTYMTAGTCGASDACQRPSCVPPGKYRAKACAAINAGANDMAAGSCMPKSTQLCAETEFELPSVSEVKLVLKKQ
jgi:hypothetical protein